MKKKQLTVVVLALSFVSLLFLAGCDKDDDTKTEPTTCDAKGSYSGTYTNYLNQTASFAYVLASDNFAYGSGTLTAPPTAFGGYSNTCDSLRLRTWNSVNGNYYLFLGKFSSNRTTVTGTYKNLTTTSETGTFTLNKQ